MAHEAALNMSLDDLIAKERQKKDTKQKKDVRKGNKPAEGDRPPRRASGGAPRRDQPRNLSITVKNQGGIAKARRAAPGAGPGPREPREFQREPREFREPREPRQEDPEKRAAALEGGGKWGHDMYSGPRGGGAGAGGARGPRAGRGPKDPTPLGTKLYISNLHFNVTDADVKELFETCGELVLNRVHYDNSGRSEGTAEVIYKEAGDADRAMRRYNNVQLDGNAMQIELIAKAELGAGGGGGGGPGGARTLSSGIRISGEQGGTRMVQLTRHFQQAAGGGASRVRGRGSVRSGVAAMQE